MAHGEITHVEIPADDLKRAQRFYEAAFGWTFETIPGMDDYPMFKTPAGDDGVGGAIGKRGESAPEQVRNTVTVDSIEASLSKIKQLGGSVVSGKDEVPGQGWYAVAMDTEGNEIGLWERLPQESR
jgi:predicted enzyme related to lactoylglutathione lyase